MSQLVNYEPSVTETVELFLNQTEKVYASTNKVCDFAEWLQFFAFDVSLSTIEFDPKVLVLIVAKVIGQITYSKRHGFLENNVDVDGMIGYLGRLFSYVAPVSVQSQVSFLRMTNSWFRWDKCHSSTFSS